MNFQMISPCRKYFYLSMVLISGIAAVRAEPKTEPAPATATIPAAVKATVTVSTPVFQVPAHAGATPVQTGEARRTEVTITGLFRLTKDITSPIYNFGRELPVLGHGGKRMIFARGIRNFYTNKNVLWSGDLEFDGEPGEPAMPEMDGRINAAGVFIGHFRKESDRVFQHNLYKKIAPNWYFPKKFDLKGKKPVTIGIDAVSPIPGHQATLVVALNGNGVRGRDNKLSVYLNDRLLADNIEWKDPGYREITLEFDSSLVVDGKNIVRLESDSKSVKFLDYIELLCPAELKLRNGRDLRVAVAPGWSGEAMIPNTAYGVDITDFGREFLLTEKKADSWSLTGGRAYFFTRKDRGLKFSEPMRLEKPDMAGIDYLAVATEDMIGELAPLLEHHTEKGLRPLAMKLADIDNVYGGGIFGTYGLWNLVRRSPNLKYLLIAGSSNRDYKNLQRLKTPSPRGIPTFMIHAMQLTVSDDEYSDNFRVAVGRVFVHNAEQLRNWVTKVLDYHPGDRVILLAGDNRQVNATGYQDSHSGVLPSILITADKREAEEVKKDILNAMNNEHADFLTYQGHAQSWNLDRKIIVAEDVGRIPPSSWLLSTCNAAYYHADYEVFLRDFIGADGKGAVGAIAATSIAMADMENALVGVALKKLAEKPGSTWGDILNAIKTGMRYDNTVKVFMLIGDPASPCYNPTPRRAVFNVPKDGVEMIDGLIEVDVDLSGPWDDGDTPLSELKLQYRERHRDDWREIVIEPVRIGRNHFKIEPTRPDRVNHGNLRLVSVSEDGLTTVWGSAANFRVSRPRPKPSAMPVTANEDE